jgi:hypothetical protein
MDFDIKKYYVITLVVLEFFMKNFPISRLLLLLWK